MLALPLHRLAHRILEQLDRHLHRHDDAVLDVGADEVGQVAAGPVLLRAQQIPGREMLEAVVAHEHRALRSLADAGAAEDEDDDGFVGRPERFAAG